MALSFGSQIERVKTLRPQLLPARRAFLLRLNSVFDAGVAKDVAAVGRHQMPVVALDLRLIVEADRTRNAGRRGGRGGWRRRRGESRRSGGGGGGNDDGTRSGRRENRRGGSGRRRRTTSELHLLLLLHLLLRLRLLQMRIPDGIDE